MEAFLNVLRSELVAWQHTWLHDNEVLMYGADKTPIVLIGFRGIEGYSPVRVVRQFGWVQPIPLIMDFSRFYVKKDWSKSKDSYAILEKSKKGKGDHED